MNTKIRSMIWSSRIPLPVVMKWILVACAVVSSFTVFQLWQQQSSLITSMVPTQQLHDHFISTRDTIQDVYNETLGFQKIFVLNMPERTDKKDLWALAGRYANITFQYIDGIRGADVNPKAVPAGWDEREGDGALGCFRGHMDFMDKMVNEKIQTALIFEDDADWDITLKSQLLQLAKGTRFLQDLSPGATAQSPYGDDWDLLWLGHCGAKNRPWEDSKYWVIPDDPTVPIQKYWGHWRRRPDLRAPGLGTNYTRYVYSPHQGLCTAAYALSLRGAEKMLLHWSVLPNGQPIDRAMQKLCSYRLSGAKCFATYPTLVSSYRAPGNTSRDSDRFGHGLSTQTTFRAEGATWGIVFPLRPNLFKLVNRLKKIPSQYKGESMTPELDLDKYQLPEGHGLFVTKDSFPAVVPAALPVASAVNIPALGSNSLLTGAANVPDGPIAMNGV